MKIDCGGCGGVIEADALAKLSTPKTCPACGVAGAWRPRWVEASTPARTDAPRHGPRRRARAPRPDRVRLATEGNDLVITLRPPWFFLLPIEFALFCLVVVGGVATMRMAGGRQAAASTAIIIVIAWLAVASVMGLLLAMTATVVRVTNNLVTVRHVPLSLHGVDLSTSSVGQFFTEQHVVRLHYRGTWDNKDWANVTYGVTALLATGEAVVMVKGLDDVGQAIWLEQQLERRLRIADVPVRREYPR